jgi:hypothetical protein
LLGYHIHPVIVHFPQAFAMTLLVTIVLGYYGYRFPALSMPLLETSRILSMFLPLSVLGGFVSGIIDGNIRYKRLNTPYLRLKIAVGLVFFISATAEAVLIYFAGIVGGNIAAILILNVLSACCTIILGNTGEKLTCAVMGG